MFMKQRPLIIHSDYNIYVIEKQDPDYSIEDELNKFAWLVKVPEGVHTYRLDEYSLWSAAAIGVGSDKIIRFLDTYSKN
jgi:DNA excision repair protein ERCC-3